MTYTLHFPQTDQCFVSLSPMVTSQTEILQQQHWIGLLEKKLKAVLKEIVAEPRGFLLFFKAVYDPQKIKTAIQNTWEQTQAKKHFTYKQWEIPIDCHPRDCHDLSDFFKGDTDQVKAYWEAFLAQSFYVQFYGFLPGFVYLNGLPKALQLPRRKEPRLTVPAGSVAVGERYVGIYPQVSPGGWQLLGQSPIALFDRNRSLAFFLEPGDCIQWVAIDSNTFESLQNTTNLIPNHADKEIVLSSS
jgi:KipI family sensor histidine kinase inhibitor